MSEEKRTTHDLARDLLQVADFLYRKEPFETTVKTISMSVLDTKEAKASMRKLGDFTKDYSDNYYFKAKVQIGGISFEIWTARSGVCKAVKKLKEVDDWECESIFEPEAVQEEL